MRLIPLLALAALTTPALAECDHFDLASDGSQRNVVFVGGDTVAVGDRRIGWRAVKRDDEPVGTHHWVGTVYAVEPNGTVTNQTGTFRLDEGDIHYTSLWDRTRPASDTALPSGNGYTGAITGGTGVFADATGTVTTTFDGTTARYSFDIDCD